MSRLFISHAGKDSFEAIAFHDWLVSEGWTKEDVFLDLHDIGAGTRWKEALAKANERCEAVVLLASPSSLASTECRLEIRMAEDYGKEIIVAILYLLTPEAEELGVYRERQIVDLGLEPRDATFTVEHKGQSKAIAFSQRTLRHIKARLDQLGISPTTFSWRPGALDTATPYPGFAGFTQHEAALFFGRAGDIARGLADMRRLRRLGSGQVMVIQAASGAGKTSGAAEPGGPYRLLREAEWEFLARAGTTTPFATGNTITTDQANFNGNYSYGGGSKVQNREKTLEAGSFAPNAFGLHDMHGNVWEWTEDCFGEYQGEKPAEPSASCRRVVRGGSGLNYPDDVRSANRFRGTSGDRDYYVGFRVGRTLTP